MAVSCLTAVVSLGQSTVSFDEEHVKENFKQHITTLASDEFEGREAGTEGEQKAYTYISEQYEEVGMTPKGTDGFLQPFPFTASGKATDKNAFKVNKKKFSLKEDFYPLQYSHNGTAKGKAVKAGFGIIAPGHNDYADADDVKGKIIVLEYGNPDGMHPHSRLAEFSDHATRIDSAISKGAVAVVFINSDEETDNPKFRYSNRVTAKDIPVMFATGDAAKAINKKNELTISLTSEIIREERAGHNVIGFIDNGAENTVVIGAHYDHLGYGDEGSLYRGKKAIHNGADDNASGVAVMIELARVLKNSGLKANNYMTIAFSAEEKGLLGSSFFVKNPTIELDKINYMMNMDMVGRIDEKEPVLIINGVGTSEEWAKTLETNKVDGLRFKTTESGVGPSDHTSFYLKSIPVMHFFSGTHSEYHKPTDDEELINYNGQADVMTVMLSVIEDMNDNDKLVFIKTKDSENKNAPRFKVTLGVVPDYAFDGQGMRIDGVSDDRPAQKAGMVAGDVVTALGAYEVNDMMSYMKALSKFSKGDTTTVKFNRDGESQEAEITF